MGAVEVERGPLPAALGSRAGAISRLGPVARQVGRLRRARWRPVCYCGPRELFQRRRPADGAARSTASGLSAIDLNLCPGRTDRMRRRLIEDGRAVKLVVKYLVLARSWPRRLWAGAWTRFFATSSNRGGRRRHAGQPSADRRQASLQIPEEDLRDRPAHRRVAANTRQRQMVAEHFKKMGAEVREQTWQIDDPQTGQPLVLVNLIGSWFPDRTPASRHRRPLRHAAASRPGSRPNAAEAAVHRRQRRCARVSPC